MWSETASFEGAPPVSAEPRGWGISVSKSGEIHLSAVRTASYSARLGERQMPRPAMVSDSRGVPYKRGVGARRVGGAGQHALDCGMTPGTMTPAHL